MAYKRFLPEYSLGLFWESVTPHYNTTTACLKAFYVWHGGTYAVQWVETAHSNYWPEKEKKMEV